MKESVLKYRQEFDVPLVAILTGENDSHFLNIIEAIFKNHYKTSLFKPKSINDLPSFLQIPLDVEIIIIELPINGQTAFLLEALYPSHGFVLDSNWEEGGEKSRVVEMLYQYIRLNKKMTFVNLDDEKLLEQADGIAIKLGYTRSILPNPENIPYEVQLIKESPLEVGFLSGEKLIQIQSNLKLANFNVLMSAIVLGKYFKVPSLKIKEAIEKYKN